jgi:hypothetical protein
MLGWIKMIDPGEFLGRWIFGAGAGRFFAREKDRFFTRNIEFHESMGTQ